MFLPIIERNTVIPASRSHPLSTLVDNQTKVDLRVYQGESRLAADNVFLGKLTVQVPPAPAGKEAIEARFSYDTSGLLEVEATVLSQKRSHRVVIEGNPGVLDKDQIRARLEALRAIKVHPRDDARNVAAVERCKRLYEENLGDNPRRRRQRADADAVGHRAPGPARDRGGARKPDRLPRLHRSQHPELRARCGTNWASPRPRTPRISAAPMPRACAPSTPTAIRWRFQRLRAAYDRASAYAARPDDADDDALDEYHDDDDDGDQADAVPAEPAAEAATGAAARRRFPAANSTANATRSRDDIGGALKVNDVRAALGLLTRALARGTLGLGEREYALDAIMVPAIRDTALPPDAYLALLQEVGWDALPRHGEWFSQAHHAALARAEAERWYLGLRRSANSSDLRPGAAAGKVKWKALGPRGQAAEILLSGRRPFWLGPDSVAQLELLLRDYDHYKNWIEHRFAAPVLTQARTVAQRGKDFQGFSKAILIAIGAVGAAFLVLLAIGAGNIFPALIAVGVGRWVYAYSKRK